jgi:outer membrane murein-binding lipoprotein Lpp
MRAVMSRQLMFFAAALAVALLAGCAEVHQNPAYSTIDGQSDVSATQSSDAQPVSSTNIPF